MKKIVISLLLAFFTSASFASDSAPRPQRIISLAPSMTEIIFSLGLGDRLVGVTSFCDYPPEAEKKARIGGMSNPSLEAIVSLKPDLVVMTMDGNPREVEARLRSLGIRTYVWKARAIAELAGAIRDLAGVLDVRARGETLAKDIEQKLGSFKKPAAARSSGKKTVFIVWPEPLVLAGPGTAIDDAITILGMRNIAGEARTTYPRYSLEEVVRAEPEVLFIGKGKGMDMHAVAKGLLKKLAQVPAVKNGKVCYVSDLLYRLTPRTLSGIEELATCVQ